MKCGNCGNICTQKKDGETIYLCCCKSFKVTKNKRPVRTNFGIEKRYYVPRVLETIDGEPIKCKPCEIREVNICEIN